MNDRLGALCLLFGAKEAGADYLPLTEDYLCDLLVLNMEEDED